MVAESNPTTWFRANAFRPPRWRWLRAQYLAENKQSPVEGIDDPWIGRARQFQAAGNSDSAGESNKLPVAMSHAIGQARDICWDRDPFHRDRLEAWLLTPVPLDRVAAACSVPPPVVTAYSELFFDVRPRLAARDWIVIHVLGCGPMGNFGGLGLGAFLKWVAFLAGDIALEVMLAIVADSPFPQRLMASFANPTLEERRIRLRGKLLLATLTATADVQRADLFAMRQRLRRVTSGQSIPGDESRVLKLAEKWLVGLGKSRRPSGRAAKLAASSVNSMFDKVRSDTQRLFAARA